MTTATVPGKDSIALRDRLVEVASRIILEEGYENLSMRRLAQEGGCSLMAAYKHFANKEALTQHICGQIYARFTDKMNREMNGVSTSWEKLRVFIAALIRFATSYPDHYSLVFLVRHSDPLVLVEREQLGENFLSGLQEIVRAILPNGASDAIVNMRLRQMLTCLHGTAALLIAHPKVYGLTKQRAISDTEETFRKLLGIPKC